MLLASLLGIIGSIDNRSIVLSLIKLFSICAKIKKSLSDIVFKDIKGTLLLRPRLLKLKVSNRKAYLNITTALSTYILIIRTKGVRPYIVGLIISL